MQPHGIQSRSQHVLQRHVEYQGLHLAIEVAQQANVKKLIITHHDPEHDDEYLRNMEKWCQQRFSNCEFAREGMVVDV